MYFFSRINFPTLLTFLRLCLGFFIFPFLIVHILPQHSLLYNSILCISFLLCGATDFLDGYLARKYNGQTLLGKILDPLADKFLMYGSWIALLALQKLWYVWVLLLICRELLVTSIRHIAVEYKFDIPVSDWGKLKSTVHIFFVALLLLDLENLHYAGWWYSGIYTILLILSLWLSWYSAWQYCKEFIIKMQKQ